MTVYCLQLHIIDCSEEACSSSLFQDNLSVSVKKNCDIVNDFKLNSVIKKNNFDQTLLR